MFTAYGDPCVLSWEIVCGSARNRGFGPVSGGAENTNVEILVMVTPAEVDDAIWHKDDFRTQHFQVCSAVCGGVLAGRWNIYIRGTQKYNNIGLATHGSMVGPIRKSSDELGM